LAPLLAILNALRRATGRDLGTFGSLKLNNFFLFIALMIWGALQSGVEPKSAEPLLLLLFLVLLFPLSSDPLQKIPPQRLASWPIGAGQRWGLRLFSLGFSPVLWLIVAILLLKRVRPALGFAFLFTAVLVQGVAILGKQAAAWSPTWSPLRYVPPFPGKLGGLVRKNVREMLSVLDVYIALLLSTGGAVYRLFAHHPDADAFPILALVVALSMSTYGQCLFGLDLRSSAMMRYRILPLAVWEILLAKDLAFLGVLLLLVSPLAVVPGITFGLAALAIGHYPSLRLPGAQQRWRFTGSRVLPGVVQAIIALALGFGAIQRGAIFFAVALALYGLSLWLAGGYWDRICPAARFPEAMAP
jgi:hypothetical protein